MDLFDPIIVPLCLNCLIIISKLICCSLCRLRFTNVYFWPNLTFIIDFWVKLQVDFLGLLVWLFKMISLMYFGKNQLHIMHFPLFVKIRSNVADLYEIRVVKEKNNNSDNSSQLPYRYWWNLVCWSITRQLRAYDHLHSDMSGQSMLPHKSPASGDSRMSTAEHIYCVRNE